MSLTESTICSQRGCKFKAILKVAAVERLDDYQSNGWEVQLDSFLAKNI